MKNVKMMDTELIWEYREFLLSVTFRKKAGMSEMYGGRWHWTLVPPPDRYRGKAEGSNVSRGAATVDAENAVDAILARNAA